MMAEIQQTTLEKMMHNRTLARFSRYWFMCFIVAVMLPLLGPERIWILIAPPLFLLVLNAYLLGLLYFQTKKPILDERSYGTPKFFIYALNSFLTFSLLSLGALIFIPGALNTITDTPVPSFEAGQAISSLLIFILCLAFTAMGALLSVVQGRKLWESN